MYLRLRRNSAKCHIYKMLFKQHLYEGSFFKFPVIYKWGPYWREALNRVITVFKSEVS